MQNEQIAEYSGLKELLNGEVMANYNEFIVKQALEYTTSAKKVVGFGAGIGTLSLIFREKFGTDTLCVEIDEENKEYLSQRKMQHFDNLKEINGDIDLIFSSNVLEHIQDDLSVLKEMTDKLSAKGKIYLYLPAKMLFWSRLDEEIGHYRRYENNANRI